MPKFGLFDVLKAAPLVIQVVKGFRDSRVIDLGLNAKRPPSKP